MPSLFKFIRKFNILYYKQSFTNFTFFCIETKICLCHNLTYEHIIVGDMLFLYKNFYIDLEISLTNKFIFL